MRRPPCVRGESWRSYNGSGGSAQTDIAMAPYAPIPDPNLKLPRVQAWLKSQRVQGRLLALGKLEQRLKSGDAQVRLKPDRIQHRLRNLREWGASVDCRALERTYLFPTLRAATLFASLVAEIGGAVSFVPEIDIRSQELRLRVATQAEAGITELDFDVARLLDLRV